MSDYIFFLLILELFFLLNQARRHLPQKITGLSRQTGPSMEVQNAGLIQKKIVGTASNLKKMLVGAS